MVVSRFASRLSVALLVLVFSTAAFAQAPGQRGGQRGAGFGGFGGGQGGIASLLAMEEVQKELKLTDEQKTKLREARSEAGGRAGRSGDGGEGGQNLRDLSREERQKRMEELRKQLEERTKKAEEAAKAILTAEQNTRLSQLRLQRDGINAITRPEVATALMLADAQKEAIAEILEASRAGRGERGAGFGRNASQEERQKAMAEAEERRKKTRADLEAVLTDSQKAEWAKMQGEKFTFPERPARGAGGRGQGRGQGGGQGGGRQRRPVEA